MVPIDECKLFQGLPETERLSLRETARVVAYKPGDIIFREGDKGDGLFVIAEGIVEIASNVGFGDPRVLSVFGPGDHFGEMALLDNEPRSATATAVAVVAVYFIDSACLRALLERAPSLSITLMREISRRLRDFNQQYIRETLESERLALVGRFASSIVHDIKNPLSVIGLASEMALMPDATLEERDVAAKRISHQLERISSMVNELLEFARGSQTTFLLERVDYSEFVTQFLEDVRPELRLRAINIDVELPLPQVKVRINPSRLARALHNLLSNASDAMPSGGIIRLRFCANDNELTTEIHDSGPGIPNEMLGRLFQAFATHGKANGTGLGLSICKKIVQDHQGRVFGRNAPQGGAVFGFTLPLK
jgi:signal transduction histidine kinase